MSDELERIAKRTTRRPEFGVVMPPRGGKASGMLTVTAGEVVRQRWKAEADKCLEEFRRLKALASPPET